MESEESVDSCVRYRHSAECMSQDNNKNIHFTKGEKEKYI